MSDGWCARRRFLYRHLVVPLHRDEAGNQDHIGLQEVGGEDIEQRVPTPASFHALLERSRPSSALAQDLGRFQLAQQYDAMERDDDGGQKGVACAARVCCGPVKSTLHLSA
jgi:hypothetical protein